jgi:serine phosphatase RsbU (regulator of sigma subunit)/ligand-binding sensor domain-containing protein
LQTGLQKGFFQKLNWVNVMKLLTALISITFLPLFAGILSWNSANLNTRYQIASPYSNNKNIDTDTIESVIANQGNPYITNYNNSGFSNQQIWSICQDNHGQMVFAHRQGLTIFNGNKWEVLRLPSIPISLKKLPEKDIILVGCDDQFGFVRKNDKGQYKYFRLSNADLRYGEITDIKLTNENIYFYSDKSLSEYSLKSLELKNEWFVEDEIKQTGIIQFNNEIFISKKNRGLYRITKDGQKNLIPKSKNISVNQIAFSLPLSSKTVLLGTIANKLYTFNGKSIQSYHCSADDYIDESQLVGGINLNDTQFALSTLSGGIIILNKENGKIIHIINYQNGLPDDEIFATGTDNEGGLWVSHGFGISRVNYDLPVKDFNYYPGIEGKLIDVLEFNNTIYIATTEGVFYLDTLKDVKEFDIYVKKTSIKKTTPILKKTKEEDNSPETKEKKSIFQKWKERREKRRQKKQLEKEKITLDEIEEVPEIVEQNKVSSKRKKIVYKKKKKRILSLSYIFKKVKGVSGKCKQLIKYEHSILVASNEGLFEIKKKSAKRILKNVYINTIAPSKTKGIFYIGTDNGFTAVKQYKESWREIKNLWTEEVDDEILSISEDKNGNLWVGSDALIYFVAIGKRNKVESVKVFDFGKSNPDKFSVREIEENIFFLSSSQIFLFNEKSGKIEPSDKLIPNKLPFLKYIISQTGITWLKNEEKWILISDKQQLRPEQIALLNIFEDIQNIRIDDENNIWVVDGKNSLYKILPEDIAESYLSNFNVYIQSIQNNLGDYVSKENIEIGPEINSLTFKISVPYYLRPEKIRYQYFIHGAMNGWAEWKQSPSFDFILRPGKYVVQVRAKNIFGNISSSKEYVIKVKTPIWRHTWFIVVVAAGVLLIVTLLIFILQKKKERKLLKYNKELEEKVEERTQEIQKQKAQIEYKNKEITDSLNYASQIQSAVLPPLKIIDNSVSESFVLNKPRDIVSGDFYWANRVNGQLVVTAADCTGHGVPGAFLSMLGVTFLNEITSKMDHLEANTILEKLRKRVIKSMHQEGYDQKRLDGIDLSMVVLDLKSKVLQFSGANNPIYIIRNRELTEFKGDRMPIGIHTLLDKPFTNHKIEVKKNDLIYMFSDGFIDQFGGEYGRKFLSKNFKALLTEISGMPLIEQKNILYETLKLWKGNRDQLDDVLVVGLKI